MSLLLLFRRRQRSANIAATVGGGGGGKRGSGFEDDPFAYIRAELIEQQNKVVIQLMLAMAASGALR